MTRERSRAIPIFSIAGKKGETGVARPCTMPPSSSGFIGVSAGVGNPQFWQHPSVTEDTTLHSTRLCLGLTVFGLLLAVGCNKPNKDLGAPQSKDYNKQLPPGEMALVKLTDPADWPDFSEGYQRRAGLEEAALYSLDYLSRSSSQKFFPYLDITHDRAVASVHAFLDVLRSSQPGEELDATIKARFDIYQSRGCDDQGTVLYTGYYRPIFDARMQPDSEFRFPLYKRPADLAQDSNGHYQRYITRSEIEHGALAGKGLELCYLRD